MVVAATAISGMALSVVTAAGISLRITVVLARVPGDIDISELKRALNVLGLNADTAGAAEVLARYGACAALKPSRLQPLSCLTAIHCNSHVSLRRCR